MEKEVQDTNNNQIKDIFDEDPKSQLLFDLLRTCVSQRIQIQALENLLIENGVVDPEKLKEHYKDLLVNSADDIINEIINRFGKAD